jgi:DNA-binding winged helix-turn-helix (wHTH) protein
MGAMRVVFGECEFDAGQRVICRAGRVIPLSPKALQLLEILVDRRPEAVAKTEILERLWPETFVSDASLHNVVTELRAALGDSPRATRYIRTVSRYGYAFQADARPAPPRQSVRGDALGPRLVSPQREWLLVHGPNLVGRDRECAVQIDSSTLSRRHARIVVTGEGSTLEDMESKNGTLVNGQPVDRVVVLKDHDEIQLGSVLVTYRDLEPMPSTLTRRSKIPR